MITFSPLDESKNLILKKIVHPFWCALCLKSPDSEAVEFCPSCRYPYDNNQSLFLFDYEQYSQYRHVNSLKAQSFFSANAVLNGCSFCGGDAVLQTKTIALYERYKPDGFFNDSITLEAFYLICTGCTFSTPLLWLYEFYAAYWSLIDAWNMGKSRLSLIKYTDLRLPDWAINFRLLDRIKKYARQYEQRFQPQNDLFSPATLTYQQRAVVAFQNINHLIIENR